MGLNRDQIFEAEDTVFLEVDAPEWGGTVRVKSLEVGELLRLAKVMEPVVRTGVFPPAVLMDIVKTTAVDDFGEMLFTEQSHLDQLMKRNAAVVLRVARRAIKLNKLDDSEDVDGSVKN